MTDLLQKGEATRQPVMTTIFKVESIVYVYMYIVNMERTLLSHSCVQYGTLTWEIIVLCGPCVCVCVCVISATGTSRPSSQTICQ